MNIKDFINSVRMQLLQFFARLFPGKMPPLSSLSTEAVKQKICSLSTTCGLWFT